MPGAVVARVQGYALGGGSGLVACADVVVAAPDAVFGFTEVRLGIIPAVISPFVFARSGPGAARRYFMTGERFDAATALRIGLVHEVADDLDAAVERFVGELLNVGAGGRPRGEAARPGGARVGSELARIAAGRRASAEGQEGLRAFLEKRTRRSVGGLYAFPSGASRGACGSADSGWLSHSVETRRARDTMFFHGGPPAALTTGRSPRPLEERLGRPGSHPARCADRERPSRR